MSRRYDVDLFEPGADNDKSLDLLTKDFAPLHMKAWSERHPGMQYNLNVSAFVSMWLDRRLKIFVAREDGKPVGYLMGTPFRPLEYSAHVFEVMDWYGAGAIEDSLFDYLDQALRILGCSELRITYDLKDKVLDMGKMWKLEKERKVLQYMRK